MRDRREGPIPGDRAVYLCTRLGAKARALGADGDMMLAAARITEWILLALAIAVATRAPRHRMIVLWLALTCTYSLYDQLLLIPHLTHAPRPYHGTARVLMHTSQIWYLAMDASVGVACITILGLSRRWIVLSVAIVLVAWASLVAGYGSAPGLYHLGPFVYRSATVYVVVFTTTSALEAFWIVQSMPRVWSETRTVWQNVSLACVIIETAAGCLRVALPFVSRSRSGYDPGAAIALATFVALAMAHVSAFAIVARSPRTTAETAAFDPKRRERSLRRVARAIERTRARLADAGAVSWHRRAAAGGADETAVAALRESSELASRVELILAIRDGVDPTDRGAVLVAFVEIVESWGEQPPVVNDTFDWAAAMERCRAMGEDPRVGPFLAILLSTFNDLASKQLLTATRFLPDVLRAIDPAIGTSQSALAPGFTPQG